MSASSINTVSSSGNKNYISGLASGMDTESIVQSLLAGTQSKIDKQTGLKQQLEWKQDTYRDLISKINVFGDKYFSYYGKGDTNLMSSSLYSTMTGGSSSPNVKISSVAGNAVSGMKIDSIERLATACTVKSAEAVTGETVGKAADFAGFTAGETYSFTVTLDGVNRTVDFKAEETAAGSNVVDSDATLKNINQVLYRNFGTSVGMKQDAVTGKMKLVKLESDGSVSDAPVEASRRVIIGSVEGGADTIKNLGFEGGFSNKLDYGTSLKDMNFAVQPQGGRYEFEINGVTVKGLTGDSTLSDVISAINGSGAGVKVSYSSASNKFIMESASTGEISDISMSQTYGNLLTTMFGVQATGVQSSLFSKDMTAGTPGGADEVMRILNSGDDSKFTLKVDGETVEITLEGKSGSSKYETGQSVMDALNSQLDKKFGTGAIKLTIDGDNKAVLKSAEHRVEFSDDDVDIAKGMAGSLGFTKGDNLLKMEAGATGTPAGTLDEAGLFGKITVDGEEFDLTDKKIGDLVNFLKGKLEAGNVSFTDGRINIKNKPSMVITGTADGTNGNPVNKLFGTDQVSTGAADPSLAADVTAGQNARLTVDGAVIERNTNIFELDGITMELTGVTAAGDSPINLTTSRDTDKIVDSLKSFVEDYNALIEELNDKISETANYRKYPPMTDAQKKEMSDKEVELWEQKSKEGLLHNDTNVTRFLSDMRMALYSTVEGAGLSLYDIGIETSDNWRDNGKLTLDEETLNSAAATNADAIRMLFTDKENGLAVILQNAVRDAANVSSGSPGSMVRYAGTKDVLVTGSTLYEEMKHITETLSNLNTKYELEKTRYWKQFTAMEQAISSMNSQSSWLTQQFSS